MYISAPATFALAALISGSSLDGVRGQQSDRCPTEAANFKSCSSFTSVNDAQACEGCIATAIDNSNPFICSDFIELLCPLLDDPATGCPCDGCQYLMQQWLKCELASGTCPFTCGYGSDNNKETLSPSPCGVEETAFAECFEYQCADAVACEQCMIENLDSFTAGGCADFSDRMCPAIKNDCPCSGCEKISERWLQCLLVNGGCPFQCSFDPDPFLDSPICEPSPAQPAPAPASSAPTFPAPVPSLPTSTTPAPAPSTPTAPTPCPSEIEAWGQCLRNAGIDTESELQGCLDCHDAYRDSVTDTTTCSDLTELICPNAQDCASLCGNCVQEGVDYEACFWDTFQAGCFPGCSDITPTVSSAPVPVPSTPTAPAPAPSSVPPPTESTDGNVPTGGEPASNVCLSQLDGVVDCLASELTQVQASDCTACTEGALNEATSALEESSSCKEVNKALCSAFGATCDCGACSEALRVYAGCVIDAATAGCQIECTTTPTEPTSTSTSPSSAAAMIPDGFMHGLAGMLVAGVVLM